MCTSCITAQQRADHRDYDPACYGCAGRRLAHMDPDERGRALDAIQHFSGYAMRQEAVRLMRIADAQIKNLRAKARR